jgi:hypothetical protein
LKIPRKTLALFIAKKKPFPRQIQKLSILHLKSVCFTSSFFWGAQLGPRGRGANPNPAIAFMGIGFIMILDLFGPAPLQILVLRKQLVRLNYFIFFVTLIFCFYIFVFYFHSWHESQFQSLLFSFMGWASLFYGVCLCRCMLSYKKRSPLAANLHFSQFTCNMHRDFERTKNTSKNTHVMLALKMELNFIFVNT